MSDDVDLVGTIVLQVNGVEIDCSAVNPKRGTGNKLVSTMNSKGQANKQAKITKTIGLSIDVFIPLTGDMDWDSIRDATLTIVDIDETWRETYFGVGVTDVSESFGDGNEAKRSLNAYATSYLKETTS